jgi:hypothetical protein
VRGPAADAQGPTRSSAWIREGDGIVLNPTTADDLEACYAEMAADAPAEALE